MNKLEDAYWKGFVKAAMMQMQQMQDPRVAQMEMILKMMPMQQQQSFERRLAKEFGIPGQNYQVNPSYYMRQ